MAKSIDNKHDDVALWTPADLFIHWFFIFLARWFFRSWACGTWNLRAGRAVVLVCNYGSLIDGLLVSMALRRPVRFMVDKQWYEKPRLNWIWKLLKAIAIDESTADSQKQMLAEINDAVKAGQTVCVFAEGSVSKTAFMRPLKKWVEDIGGDYDLVPVYIGGSWKSCFSYRDGKPSVKFSFKRKQAGVCIGEVMKRGSSASEIEQQICLLSGEYFNEQKNYRKSLGQMFISSARKNWNRKCVADADGKELTFGQALVASMILAGHVKKAGSQKMVAIFLPSSVAGVLTNLAVTLAGKIAVNLNYTASVQNRTAAIRECEIETIITSRIFLSRLGETEPFAGAVYVEDIIKQISTPKKIITFLKARFLPSVFLCGGKKFTADDTAAVIYSSGSSGRPKGVVLSHHNIISNIESLLMAYRFDKGDNLCGILPLFHAFGYTCTFWLPMIDGLSVSYCPNPLDADTVARTVKKHKSTFLFSTPAFLSTYTKRISVESFASLRIVVAGAERLKPHISQAFKEKFGIVPFEGYGATEMSPVAALNVPDVERDGFCERGTKASSVGRPIPGVAVKILDMMTDKPVMNGCEGILYCKGPNIMAGYYKMPDKTKEAFTDGWYNTGDVAHIDSEGFIVVLDRLSRFSKIGGEMVPHITVEEVYMSAFDCEEQVLAITSIPHERKSEELVVLYTAAAEEHISEMHDFVMKSSLPNMWKPKRSNYFKVDKLPLLGSGKLDIMRLKKLALDAKLESDN